LRVPDVIRTKLYIDVLTSGFTFTIFSRTNWKRSRIGTVISNWLLKPMIMGRCLENVAHDASIEVRIQI